MTHDPTETRPTWTDPADPLQPAAPVPTQPVPTQPVSAQPQTVADPRRRRGPLDWLLIGAAVLAVGGVAFAIGRTTAPSAAAITFPNGATLEGGGPVVITPDGSFDPGAGGPGAGGPGFLGGGGLTVEGAVTAIDATSLTLRLASGDTMTIALDDETTYQEATATDASAVAVGDDVSVRVDGGLFGRGGNAGSGGTGVTPDLTASDVTVNR